MNTAHTLAVLVTRPREQASALVSALQQLGVTTYLHPTLAITPCTTDSATLLVALSPPPDWVMFISVNAVDAGLNALARAGACLAPRTRLAAVGHATAEALHRHGYAQVLSPTTGTGSEALLACAELQNLTQQRVLIFRGQGGREWLAEQLQQRGADVQYLEVYRREPCPADPSTLNAFFTHANRVVSCTSNESLQNLYAILEGTQRDLMHATPIIAVSERLVELARSLGHRAPIRVTTDASDAAQIRLLQQEYLA